MYNEDQPKKKSGCLIWILLLIFIVPTIFFAVMAVFVITAVVSMGSGEPEHEISIDSFESIATENGFTCSMTDKLQPGMANTMKAELDDCVVYFMNGGDAMFAQEMLEYDMKEMQVGKDAKNQFEYTSDSFQSYTKETLDTFYYVCSTKDTVIYVMVPIHEKEKAMSLLNAIDYWNEPPEFVDELEGWMEGLEDRFEPTGGQ